MTTIFDQSGAPYDRVPPKRSWDTVPIQIDWHDYLINLWRPGTYFDFGSVTRPRREAATGLEYICTRAGYTEKKEPRWPRQIGESEADGAAEWTAQPITVASQRTQVLSSSWVAPSGVSLGAESVADLVYTVLVSGGDGSRLGNSYEIANRITMANGEQKEGVVILPVRDTDTEMG